MIEGSIGVTGVTGITGTSGTVGTVGVVGAGGGVTGAVGAVTVGVVALTLVPAAELAPDVAPVAAEFWTPAALTVVPAFTAPCTVPCAAP